MIDHEREELRLVSYSILFTKRGLEVAFPERQEMVTGCISPLNFQTWKVAEFIQGLPLTPQPPKWRAGGYPPAAGQGRVNALPPGDEKYLRVHCRLEGCYPREPLHFFEDQLKQLAGIRDALIEKQAVLLPKSMKLSGSLDPSKSGFVPRFLHFPPSFGPVSEPATIRLTGRVEVEFQPPEGDYAEFEVRYCGLGNACQFAFQGGQEYDLLRNRSFSNSSTQLPDGSSLRNGGRLNLKTGEVEGLQINAILQNSVSAQFDRINRLPSASCFLYPQPLPPGKAPDLPPEPAAGHLEFSCDERGRIVGLELHSRSTVPAGLLPHLPGFPPFCFGPGKAAFFPNPTRCSEETSEEDCPSEITHPDGFKLPDKALFYPRFDLVAQGLGEVAADAEAASGQTVEEEGAVLVAAGQGLFRVRASSQEDLDGKIEIRDLQGSGWVQLPPLPRQEESQGGWTDDEAKPFPAHPCVLNGAGASAAPSALCPGSRAILWGIDPVQSASIRVGGKKASILAQSPGRVDFLVPEIKLKGKSRSVHLEVPGAGSGQPLQVAVDLQPSAPGLYVQSNGELFDPDYLHECAALACNEDGSFNCPSQPARPGEEVTLYATGLGEAQVPEGLRVLAGPTGRQAQVLAVTPLDGQPGVDQIRIRLPEELPQPLTNNLLILLFAGKAKANPAVIAVREKAFRLDPVLTGQQGLEAFFPSDDG